MYPKIFHEGVDAGMWTAPLQLQKLTEDFSDLRRRDGKFLRSRSSQLG